MAPKKLAAEQIYANMTLRTDVFLHSVSVGCSLQMPKCNLQFWLSIVYSLYPIISILIVLHIAGIWLYRWIVGIQFGFSCIKNK